MSVGEFKEELHGIAPGTVMVWSGLLSDIPSEWALCDGNNGTPDLRDRFVKCVPDTATAPGGTGGQSSYTLTTAQLPSHNHNASTGNAGGHDHMVGTDDRDYGNANAYSHGHDTGSDFWSSYSGGHNHTDPSVGSAGGSSSVNNTPSYYEVGFVMKL